MNPAKTADFTPMLSHAVSVTSTGPSPKASGRLTYEIVLRGDLSEHFTATFLSESLASTVGQTHVESGDGTTTIEVEVIDQAHLLAILERLRDLSLEIERVNPAIGNEGKTR
jgi:hypothetical protein